MTKMATTPIQGKKPFKLSQYANSFGTWYAALGMLAQPSSHK